MPNPMMMPGGMFGMVAGAPRKKPEEEKRQSYWQGGDKFTLRDGFAGALAAVGDGLNNWANGSGGGATNMLVGGRGKAIEQAKAAQKAAMEAQQREADLRAAGITPEQGRLLGDNVGGVLQKRMEPAPRNDTVEDFNWYKGLSDEDRAIYQDMKPEYRQGADGQFYRVDKAPSSGGYSQLPPGYTVRGAQSAPSAQAAPVAPLRSPTTINRQQYETQLRQFGGDQASMNAWMRANNIIAGN